MKPDQLKKADTMQTATDIDPQYRKAKNLAAERERTKQGTATPERIIKAGDGFEKNVGRENAQRVVEAPLDRLRKSGRISGSEYEAGDRFRGDAYLAAVDPGSGTVDWQRAGGGGRSSFVPSMFESQHIYDARKRYREVQLCFRGLIWSVLQNALVHEHSLEEMGHALFGRSNKRDAAVSGDAGFRVALAALADRYAMGFDGRGKR